MATAPIVYADFQAVIAHPIDRIWALVADFGALDSWAAGVTGCVLEGHGPGAIRTVSIGDRVAHERLEAIDPRRYQLRYQILPPHTMPAGNIYSNIVLTAIDANRTGIRWTSEATDFGIPPGQLGVRIEGFYGKSIEGLRRLLDAA